MSLGLLLILSLNTNVTPAVVSYIDSVVQVPFRLKTLQALEVLLNEYVLPHRMLN